MRRYLKFSTVIIVILIIIPIIYLIYDRLLMPPKPDWPVPAFTPDPENTPKIGWLKGAGNNYFLSWLESHKENNALVHYINAFSSMTIPEDTLVTIDTVLNEGWHKPYPELDKALKLNQKALEEVRLGKQIGKCTFPPNPYSVYGPMLNFITTRRLARLMVVTGRKVEYEKQYSQALQFYFDGMQFGKDIAPKDQSLVGHLIGVAIIKMQLTPILELIIQDKLSEKDLKQIISECAQIEKEQTSFVDPIEIEYRTFRTLLESINKLSDLTYIEFKIERAVDNIYFYFYKGHVLHEYVKYSEEYRNALSNKTYQEFMQINWGKKFTKAPINNFSPELAKSYTVHMTEICLLRLAQVDAAIRLYHLKNNQWPKLLDELKPKYLTEIPLDPFINQPFHLAQDSTGMFAYSVGPDFKDDSVKLIYGEGTTNRDLGDIR